MEAFESRPAKMDHRYCSPPSCVHGKITSWYFWIKHQALVPPAVSRLRASNGPAPGWELWVWSTKEPLSNRDSEGETGSLGICSDTHSLIHSFDHRLPNTFFILGLMFLLTTSGTPVSHHPAHVLAESLLVELSLFSFKTIQSYFCGSG